SRRQYCANTEDTGGTQGAQAAAYSASIEHNQAGSWAALANDENKELNNNNVKANRAAAKYDWAPVNIRAFCNHAHKTSLSGAPTPANSDTYCLGLRYLATAKVALKTQVHQLRRDNDAKDKATQYAVGADYLYAPNLTFYVNYAQVDADGLYRAPTNAGRSAQIDLKNPKIQNDESPYAVSVGTIFKF